MAPTPTTGATPCQLSAPRPPPYALDLIGFGRSSQPQALLKGEQTTTATQDGLHYSFDLWGEQVASFCRQVVNRPVLLVGNSIGGVVALRAAQLLAANPEACTCKGVVLIDCAQRLMDDKQLATQPAWMAWIRPLLKALVSQRWLSSALFRNAARPSVIRSVLKQAYPSGSNVDNDLVQLLFQPTQRPGAAEAFRGFINLFDDYLAPDLLRRSFGARRSDLGRKRPLGAITRSSAMGGKLRSNPFTISGSRWGALPP